MTNNPTWPLTKVIFFTTDEQEPENLRFSHKTQEN